MRSAGGGLPAGYTRVKCITKTNSQQYIDTGLNPAGKMYLKEFDYEFLQGASAQPVFGARNSTGGYQKFCIWINYSLYPALNYANLDSGYITIASGATGRHNITTTPNPDVSMSFDGNSIYSDTTTYYLTGGYTGHLLLFNVTDNTAPMTRACSMKLYGVCIADENGDLFRAVPVIRNSDSEPGFYDFVSGTFFAKADQNLGNFGYEAL